MATSRRSAAWVAVAACISGCAPPPVAPIEVLVSSPSVASAAAPSATAPPRRPSTAGMVLLPGDTFPITLGSILVKTAKVLPFWMDTAEVTADAYGACARAGECSAAGLSCGEHATHAVSGKGNHPINCVDWEQASAYCRAQSKRLPTEDEWEWAARGTGRGTTFPWGNDEPPLSQICWARFGVGDTAAGTCAVGTFPLGDSPQGLHDLQGNVSEWTSSKEEGTTERVTRGGSWADNVTESIRASASVGQPPSTHDHRLGFRCALSAQ